MVPFGNFGWNFGFGFGWILVVLTLVLIAFGIVQLVRSLSGDRQRNVTGTAEETPLDVLEKRYARGEITKDEFERKRDDIIRSESEHKRAA
jgi:putative membrane protein